MRPGLPPPGAPIEWIDTHVHLVGGRGPNIDYRGAVADAVAAMDEAGIRRMVVMPPPQVTGVPPPPDFDSFLPAIKPHRARFAFLGGGGSLNPIVQDTPAEAVNDRVRHRFVAQATEILKQGAAGFGEITAHHLSHTRDHPYESTPADHPLLLLLADIAARHQAVIDFHFDVVAEDMEAPGWVVSPPNPRSFRANLPAFERFLAHNRGAQIVWAHVGSDQLGQWTVALSRRLLTDHSNLYMSFRMAPGRAPQNHPMTRQGTIKPEWLRLLQDFPDRFVLGGDQFFVSDSVRGSGPARTFSQRAPLVRQRTRAFLAALPADLARKIGYENAIRLYKLTE